MSILPGLAAGALAISALTAGRAPAADLAVSACSPGSVYYVATTGDDNNPGTLASPWRTLRKAATAPLLPCDTVYVRGGVYYDMGVFITPRGAAGKPISYLAYPGEHPVIDSSRGPSSPRIKPNGWTETIGVQGAYLQIAGFELRNGGTGAVVYGPHDILANLTVHDMQQHGIWAKGDHNLVEFSLVTHVSAAQKSKRAKAGWAFGIGAGYNPVSGVTHFPVLRGNVVSDVWGEGINAMGVDNAIIDGNTAFDNWAQNIYVNNATNTICRNNLAYNTPDNEVGRRAPGITLADELTKIPLSAHVAVVNNTLYNADLYAFGWTLVPGSGLVDALISNNTVVDGALVTGSDSGSVKVVNAASLIQNNILFRDDGGGEATVPTSVGLTFRNNSWSRPPPRTAAGAGDLIGDPMLSRAGPARRGQLSMAYFAASPGSPVSGAGAPVAMTTPAWRISTVPGSAPNIGAVAGNPAIQYR